MWCFCARALFLAYSVDFRWANPDASPMFSSFLLAFFNFSEVRRRSKCAYSVDQFVFQFWAAIDRPLFDIVVNLQSFLTLPDAGWLAGWLAGRWLGALWWCWLAHFDSFIHCSGASASGFLCKEMQFTKKLKREKFRNPVNWSDKRLVSVFAFSHLLSCAAPRAVTDRSVQLVWAFLLSFESNRWRPQTGGSFFVIAPLRLSLLPDVRRWPYFFRFPPVGLKEQRQEGIMGK